MLEDKISSATTYFTKTYVEGGTTPNSKIVIKKPKRNYTTLGLLGIVGVYVVYKVFFNKKSK
jgi:fructose 1,6-bisphosphatase